MYKKAVERLKNNFIAWVLSLSVDEVMNNQMLRSTIYDLTQLFRGAESTHKKIPKQLFFIEFQALFLKVSEEEKQTNEMLRAATENVMQSLYELTKSLYSGNKTFTKFNEGLN